MFRSDLEDNIETIKRKKNTFGLGKLHYYQTNMNLEVIVGSFVFSQFVYFFKKMHSDV
jgi:hypothetical protein